MPRPHSRLHVVGGGLAGLAAALAGSRAGWAVEVWEASPGFGGRCRSFVDPVLGRRVDNGNHLLLAGNRAAMRHLAETGGDRAVRLAPARFPCLDLESGERWEVGVPNGGVGFPPRPSLPPGVAGGGLLRDLGRLWRLKGDAPLGDALPEGPARRLLWDPLVRAVMNMDPDEAAAPPFRRALGEILARGPGGLRPVLFPRGLAAALVDPALDTLRARGAGLHPGRRVVGLDLGRERALGLGTRGGTVALSAGDALVVALPPSGAAALLPGLAVPEGHSPILGAHFALDAPRLPVPFMGLVGGTAEWLFQHEGVLSATVSAAGAADDAALPARLWADAARALGCEGAPPPPARLVREKAATFRQTPAGEALRPPARTRWRNVALAGDWTRTGLPATIEGALRSGASAVRALG